MTVRGKTNGTVTFIFNSNPGAKNVYLVGDFNQWDPKSKRMMKNKDGSFQTNVRLSAGEYQYKFIADGVWLSDPDAQRQVMNPYGTLNSVITVA